MQLSTFTYAPEGGWSVPAFPDLDSPQTLVVVLDRSGSMGGDRLDAAKHALSMLVTRLDPKAP